MLTITVKNYKHYTSYQFYNRGTFYDIVTNGQGTYDVWTKRKAVSRRRENLQGLTLQEMETKNKTLAAFVNLMLRG